MASPLSTKDTLDSYLVRVRSLGIAFDPIDDLPKNVLNLYGVPIRIGQFVFDVYEHSTGNHVQVWILHPDGSVLRIINGTWWFSSRYQFNEWEWLHGKWSQALEVSIKKIRDGVLGMEKELAEKKRLKEEDSKVHRDAEKERFESLF